MKSKPHEQASRGKLVLLGERNAFTAEIETLDGKNRRLNRAGGNKNGSYNFCNGHSGRNSGAGGFDFFWFRHVCQVSPVMNQ